MTLQAFEEWIGRIYATEGEELDYQEAEALLAAYAEAVELHGAYHPELEAHLAQNPDLQELFIALRYFVELEESGELDSALSSSGAKTEANELTPAIGS